MAKDEVGNPVGVMSATTMGVLAVVIRELVRNGAIKPEDFLAGLDQMAATPQPEPLTQAENRMEQQVFAIARQAVQTAHQD